MADNLPPGWTRGSGDFKGQIWNGKEWVSDFELHGEEVGLQQIDEQVGKRATRLKFFGVACWVAFALSLIVIPRPVNALVGFGSIGVAIWVFFSSRHLKRQLSSDPDKPQRTPLRQVREAFAASSVFLIVVGGILLLGLVFFVVGFVIGFNEA